MIDKEIIRIASNTENHGALDNHTHFSKLKNSICGDDMKIYLIVENNKITNFKYECESCIYCQASVSLLSRKAKNKLIEKVKFFAHSTKFLNFSIDLFLAFLDNKLTDAWQYIQDSHSYLKFVIQLFLIIK